MLSSYNVDIDHSVTHVEFSACVFWYRFMKVSFEVHWSGSCILITCACGKLQGSAPLVTS